MSKIIDAPHSKTRYADIRRDKIFQLVFAAKENQGLLIKLMNYLLPSMHITKITLLNKDKHGHSVDDRHCVFDVFCLTENEEHVLIEMQYNVQDDFQDRTLYYSTYPIREQIVARLREAKREQKKKNLKYPPRIKYRLDAVHVVGIVNYSIPHKEGVKLEEGLVCRYWIMESSKGERMTDALEFVFLELDRMNYGADHPEKCKGMLEKLAFSLKYINELKEQPAELRGDFFDDLFQAAEMANWSAKRVAKYDEAMMTEIDMGNYVANEIEKGIEKGLKEAREKVRGEVREEVKEEVREERSIEIAKALLSKDIAPELVSASTGISIEVLKSL